MNRFCHLSHFPVLQTWLRESVNLCDFSLALLSVVSRRLWLKEEERTQTQTWVLAFNTTKKASLIFVVEDSNKGTWKPSAKNLPDSELLKNRLKHQINQHLSQRRAINKNTAWCCSGSTSSSLGFSCKCWFSKGRCKHMLDLKIIHFSSVSEAFCRYLDKCLKNTTL